MRFLILAFVSTLIASCSSVEKSESRQRLSLERALKLLPGKSDQNTIRSILGHADIIVQIPDSEDVAWIFNDKKTSHQKLSLVFDSRKTLQSVLWLVSENEPEIKLENSKKRFPDAKFVSEDPPWENPHAGPYEKIYSDQEKGISITFRKTRQDVESISWFNPVEKSAANRKPAVKYEL